MVQVVHTDKALNVCYAVTGALDVELKLICFQLHIPQTVCIISNINLGVTRRKCPQATTVLLSQRFELH